MIAHLPGVDAARKLADFAGFAREMRSRRRLPPRAVAVVSEALSEPYGVAVYRMAKTSLPAFTAAAKWYFWCARTGISAGAGAHGAAAV